MLRRWGDNPANPKNVQISFMAVIGISELLNKISPDALTDDEREAYDFIRNELEAKKARVRNRQAFTAIVHARSSDEKQLAYECYQNTKIVNSL